MVKDIIYKQRIHEAYDIYNKNPNDDNLNRILEVILDCVRIEDNEPYSDKLLSYFMSQCLKLLTENKDKLDTSKNLYAYFKGRLSYNRSFVRSRYYKQLIRDKHKHELFSFKTTDTAPSYIDNTEIGTLEQIELDQQLEKFNN